METRPEGRAPDATAGLDSHRDSTSPDRPAPYRKTKRTAPPRGVTLAEPVLVDRFWKNRKGDAICVSLSTYEGFNLADIRQHFTAKDGRLLPTKKGIALNVLRLPDLATAIGKALAKAIELGLIEQATP